MAASPARLGDYTFLVDPLEVEWTFRMRMSEQHTVGGRVIQVYGTDLGDMTVRVTMGRGDVRRGDTRPWEAVERFINKMEDLAQASADNSGARPLRFTLPVKGWAFDVYIKAVSPVNYSPEVESPEITLTLFIVEDVTGRVTKGIVDKYIERLAQGVGWSRSEYNGPTDKEVEAMLAPYEGSPGKAYKEAIVDAFTSALGSVGMGGIGAAIGGATNIPGDLGKFLWALREQESGHNYTAVNEIGAAGAYQYMPGTWANYRGYSSAHLAPSTIQDEKAAADASKFFSQYKDWGLVASIWYSGQPVGPSGPNSHLWSKGQGQYPTIGDYVTSILSKMAQAPT